MPKQPLSRARLRGDLELGGFPVLLLGPLVLLGPMVCCVSECAR